MLQSQQDYRWRAALLEVGVPFCSGTFQPRHRIARFRNARGRHKKKEKWDCVTVSSPCERAGIHLCVKVYHCYYSLVYFIIELLLWLYQSTDTIAQYIFQDDRFVCKASCDNKAILSTVAVFILQKKQQKKTTTKKTLKVLTFKPSLKVSGHVVSRLRLSLPLQFARVCSCHRSSMKWRIINSWLSARSDRTFLPRPLFTAAGGEWLS